MIYVRVLTFVIGLIVFSFGISLSIKMQYLGLHPWDVLSVGLYDKVGLSVGSWNIIIGIILIIVAFVLDRSYIKVGTFFNAILVGLFVDFYLWSGLLPDPSHLWLDITFMIIGIIIMGVGGGLYNAAKLGSGPRDGFMLSISDKTGYSIGRVRIVTETSILVLGLLIGGPVFLFTFIFTFIQSPIFQFSYLRFLNVMDKIEKKLIDKQEKSYKTS
ncbi:MAG TPA: YitT family protein [Pseudogracilibacillus sp.]|nr:YitT family protein [Pseudogracilibacillus sp.]